MAQTRSFTSLIACMLYLVFIDPAAFLLFTVLLLYACCFSAFLKLINNQWIKQKIGPRKSMPFHLSRFWFSGCLNSIKYLAMSNPRYVKKKPLNNCLDLKMRASKPSIIRKRSKGRLSRHCCFGQITYPFRHPFSHSFLWIRREARRNRKGNGTWGESIV